MAHKGASYLIDPDLTEPEDVAGGRWRAISRSASVLFKPGDSVLISPGRHQGSLKVQGEGTREQPIRVRFLPGIHIFDSREGIALPFFVSNACDAPHSPKSIGIFLHRAKHVRVEGLGISGPSKTTLLYADRMIQVLNDEVEDVRYSNLVFDLKHPTVVEFRVLESSKSQAIIAAAEGSEYRIESGTLSWRNDLGFGEGLCQELELATGRCQRMPGPPPWEGARVTELEANRLQLTFEGKPNALKSGFQYHYRKTLRDTVGVCNHRSKDIVFQSCEFNALTGLGIVSQFTENIFFKNVDIIPPAGTIRTCPAWGDAFHFSGCKGDVVVDSCRISGMQDDAINCHGTYLKIVERRGDSGLMVRFMQPQTYGFPAFKAGDEVAVMNGKKLREYADNPRRQVLDVSRVNDTDWFVELDGTCPYFEEDDVIDNVTWHPNFTATNNHISIDPVRGFLVTTRGRTLITHNTFFRCRMAGVLVESDAGEWFESGPVRDMCIRDNQFIDCGVEIYPRTQSKSPDEPVHENVRIEGNYFENSGIWARNVGGLSILRNSNAAGRLPVDVDESCSKVVFE